MSRKRRELRTLTALRRRLGMSQQELADALGVSQPEVSLYENGVAPVSPARADEILTVFANHQDSKLLPDGIDQTDLQEPWESTVLRLAHRQPSHE